MFITKLIVVLIMLSSKRNTKKFLIETNDVNEGPANQRRQSSESGGDSCEWSEWNECVDNRQTSKCGRRSKWQGCDYGLPPPTPSTPPCNQPTKLPAHCNGPRLACIKMYCVHEPELVRKGGDMYIPVHVGWATISIHLLCGIVVYQLNWHFVGGIAWNILEINVDYWHQYPSETQFGDTYCINVGNLLKLELSLPACLDACWNHKPSTCPTDGKNRCNGVNYRSSNKDCVLRKCTQLGTLPQRLSTSYFTAYGLKRVDGTYEQFDTCIRRDDVPPTKI